MNAKASDDFFNSDEAQAAYQDALAFDRAAVAPALVVAASGLIAGGTIDDSYSATDYARDFMGRV